MAKSTRSKVKRAYRSKKRTEGVYHALEAARLQRLSAKLCGLAAVPLDAADAEDPAADGEAPPPLSPGAAEDMVMPEDQEAAGATMAAENMDIDGDAAPSSTSESKRISTHGPRNSRREQWRASKGLDARPKARGMTRQGTVAARRKSGRPSRRR